ncbi:MAG TPA: hypothetical protein VGU20_16890 [Stellaceae bacterium]|nr:hypothetical protein [Stellaceae bacterium]
MCSARRTAVLLFIVATMLGAAPAGARDPVGAACGTASPELQPLAKVVNTRDTTYHCLGVSVDAHAEIVAIRFETHSAAEAGGARVRSFTPDEIARTQGVVLDGTPGHDAVILQGDIVAGQPSTTLHLKFLHNGITGEFYQCAVTLDHTEGAPWRLGNRRPDAFPVVVVRTWAMPFFGTVGIDTVEGICP